MFYCNQLGHFYFAKNRTLLFCLDTYFFKRFAFRDGLPTPFAPEQVILPDKVFLRVFPDFLT